MDLKFTTTPGVTGILVSTSTDRSIGNLYIEEDGFWVFNPDTSNPGYWNESSLGMIIEKLKELNKPLNEKLHEDFKRKLWILQETCITILPPFVR